MVHFSNLKQKRRYNFIQILDFSIFCLNCCFRDPLLFLPIIYLREGSPTRFKKSSKFYSPHFQYKLRRLISTLYGNTITTIELAGGHFMFRESTSKTFPVLAIITVLLTGSTLAFYFLVGDQVLNEKSLYIDQIIFEWTTAMPDWVKQIMLWVTKVGSVPALTATSLLLMGYFLLFSTYSKWFAAYFAVNMIGISGITKALKIFYSRPRPDETEFGGTSASFPSGHTSGAVAFFGFIIYIVLVSNLSSSAKWAINLFSAFMIAAISISRVFGHIHYPTDVIAGLGIGFSWLFISILALEMTLMREEKSHVVKKDSMQA